MTDEQIKRIILTDDDECAHCNRPMCYGCKILETEKENYDD